MSASIDMKPICAVLATIVPTAPITVEDTCTVFAMLRPYVNAPFKLDVYHTHTTLRVCIRCDGETIYSRELPVI